MDKQELSYITQKINLLKKFEDGLNELMWNDLNKMSRSDMEEAASVLARKFIHTHRTLQQSLISLIHLVFVKLVKEFDIDSDLRNEEAVKFIKECVEKEHYFPFI